MTKCINIYTIINMDLAMNNYKHIENLVDVAHQYYSATALGKKQILKDLGIVQVTLWRKLKDAEIDVKSIKRQYEIKYQGA